MLPKSQSDAWRAFYESAGSSDELDERTVAMLQLAVAMSSGCEP